MRTKKHPCQKQPALQVADRRRLARNIPRVVRHLCRRPHVRVDVASQNGAFRRPSWHANGSLRRGRSIPVDLIVIVKQQRKYSRGKRVAGTSAPTGDSVRLGGTSKFAHPTTEQGKDKHGDTCMFKAEAKTNLTVL